MSVMPAAPSVALADVQSATQLLNTNPGIAASGAPSASVQIIDEVIDAARMAQPVINPFFDWITQALSCFNEILEGLTGSSAQITAHIQNLGEAADHVESQREALVQARSTAGGCWEGESAQAFTRTVDASVACTSAAAGTLRYVAQAHVVIMGRLADTKLAVVKVVAQLATDLCLAVARFLAQMGLAITGGVITVVGGTVAGAVGGAVEGAASGWRSGGFLGAVGGFFQGFGRGGVQGFQDGAALAKELVQQAFRNFVQWALSHVSTVLDQVHEFITSTIEPLTAVIGQISGAGDRAARAASLLLGRGDPGANADPGAAGTFGQQAQGTTPQRLDGDLIALNLAIGDPSAPLPPGYSRVSDPAALAELGLTPDMLKDENGFAAEVFRTPDGRYVVAFAGTGAGDNNYLPDVAEDVVGAGTVSPQTGNVLAITSALQRSGHSDDVVFTGHSLGGRLAAVAALDTGNAAVTYDAAGVSQATIDYVAHKNGMDPAVMAARANDGQIRTYYAGDDPLTAAQQRWTESADRLPDALGHQIQLGETEHYDPTAPDGLPDIGPYRTGHFLDTMDELWHDEYGRNGERIR